MKGEYVIVNHGDVTELVQTTSYESANDLLDKGYSLLNVCQYRDVDGEYPVYILGWREEKKKKPS